jgi:outer membrane lipoprotein-sorting protein
MFSRLMACIGLCLYALGGAAAEGPLPSPTVEYSADRTMESDAGTFTGKVHFTKDKERAEMQMQGMSSVTIQRRDKQLSWMLMPAQRMYMERSIREARQQMRDGPPDNVTISEVGKETVGGVETTKYKLLMRDGSAGGFMWFTREGIAMKMDLLQKQGGEKTRMTITLSNLKIGPQDPALFEVPSGYNKMPNMGRMLGAPGMGDN